MPKQNCNTTKKVTHMLLLTGNVTTDMETGEKTPYIPRSEDISPLSRDGQLDSD